MSVPGSRGEVDRPPQLIPARRLATQLPLFLLGGISCGREPIDAQFSVCAGATRPVAVGKARAGESYLFLEGALSAARHLRKVQRLSAMDDG